MLAISVYCLVLAAIPLLVVRGRRAGRRWPRVAVACVPILTSAAAWLWLWAPVDVPDVAGHPVTCIEEPIVSVVSGEAACVSASQGRAALALGGATAASALAVVAALRLTRAD